ncbi:MAG: hypothetical protein EAZ07_07995 [Cytophagales bacterium]|nr:MAG: hypothetical protein EAZ07_07995 [Cytophagales bacterium]
MNKEKFTWQIDCQHTPETIDRILMPIRKRAMMVVELHYTQKTNDAALCKVVFEAEAAEAERIYKNMLRIIDIIEIHR